MFSFFSSVASDPSQLKFILNKGQWEPAVKYRSEIKGGRVFLEDNGFTFLFYPKNGLVKSHTHPEESADFNDKETCHAIKLGFLNSNPFVKLQAIDSLPYYHNYFSGSDSRQWASHVPLYKKIYYLNIYPNIDVVSMGNGTNFRYDLLIKPGASVSDVKLNYKGQDRLELRGKQLILQTQVGEIAQQEPYAYQMVNGHITKVSCEYVLQGQILSFKLSGPYHKGLPVTIDPTLIFATYSGSTTDNFGMTATYDPAGNGYTAGVAYGGGYPTTAGAFQLTFHGPTAINSSGTDISVSKFSTNGNNLLYSTYLGGSGYESPQSIIVDHANNLIVLGRTSSLDFPVTSGAYSTTNHGSYDIILTKFNTTGTALMASTYIGGSANDAVNSYTPGVKLNHNYADDARGDVQVDMSNNIYVGSCTLSSNFPTTTGALQTTSGGFLDACFFKFNPSLSTLAYSSYLGGADNDAAYSIALDNSNSLYISGGTGSTGFPTTSGVLSTSYSGNIDGFISHISLNGSSLLQSSFIGNASYDQSYFVQLDPQGNVYLYGQCSGNFPITSGVYFNPNSGQFIQKLNPALTTLLFSTMIGAQRGVPDIAPSAFLVDNCFNIYISGWGSNLFGAPSNYLTTTGLPITPGAFQATTDGNDFYFMVLAPNATSLIDATYFGGALSEEHVDGGTSRFDKSGIIYQAICEGCGGHSDMPTVPGVWSPTNNAANCNNALVKFKFDIRLTAANFLTVPNILSGCAPFHVTFTNNSINAVNYIWSFGDGTTSTTPSPVHTYTTPGTYQIKLIARDSTTCNKIDSSFNTVHVLPSLPLPTIPTIHLCQQDSSLINFTPTGNLTYTWTPALGLSSTSISNPWVSADTTTMYHVQVKDSLCAASDSVLVTVSHNNTQISVDPNHACLEDTVTLSANTVCPIYSWSTGSSASAIRVTQGGMYYLTTFNAEGCKAIDSFYVDTFSHVPLIPSLLEICKGSSAQLFSIEGNYGYSWSPPATLNHSQIASPIAMPIATTIYTVMVLNGTCLTTNTFSVYVNPLPPLKVTPTYSLILPGESAFFEAIADSIPTWAPYHTLNCFHCYQVVASPDSTTMYSVSVTNQFGCVHTEYVKVEVRPTFYIPNTFTPNSNDINEIFKPVFSGYVELDVYIFDRWGTEIYHYNTLDGGWNGTYKGADCKQDVYVYKITARDFLRQELIKTGHVLLLR